MFQSKLLRTKLSVSKIVEVTLGASLLSSILVACSMPKPQSREGNQDAATFYVDKSEISFTSQTLHPKISLPLSKTFTINACIKDLKLQKSVLNNDFHVVGESDKKITSDANGCLNWNETVEYNHLAPARYIEMKRSIEAHGFHKGHRTVRFAINPWEDSALSLLDREVPELVAAEQSAATLKGLSKDGKFQASAISFDDLRLTVEEKRINEQGLVLNFDIRTQPSFARVKASGQKLTEALTYGEFEGELALIHSVSEKQLEVRRLLAAPVSIQGKMVNNFLLIETNLPLARICTRGQLQLGLKLKALGAPDSVRPFEGVFIVGECDQLKGNAFSRLKNVFQENNGHLTIQDYLTDKSNPSETKLPHSSQDTRTVVDTQQPDYYQRSQIEIKKLHFDNVSFEGKSALNRTKTFNVTACLKSGLDQKSMRAQTFQITKVNGQTDSIRSSDDGCISWDDSIQFNFLAQECWIQKEVQINNSNLNVAQTIKLNINPWSGGEASIRDVRFLDSQGQKLRCSEGKSEIILSGYSFDKKDISYDIDSFLNLKMRKTGTLKLTPILKRPSLSEPNGYSQEPIPMGTYVLKFAVVDNSVKDLKKTKEQIFQVDEKLVSVNGAGIISEMITLESSNIKAIGNTNQLILEIIPARADALEILKQNAKTNISDLISKETNVEITTYSSPLILANNGESGNSIAIQSGTSSQIDTLRAQMNEDKNLQTLRQSTLSKKDTFAKNENVKVLNLNDEKQTLEFRKSLANPVWWYADARPKEKEVAALDTIKVKAPLYDGKLDSEFGQRLCAYWFFDQFRRPVKKVHVKYLPLTGKPGDVEIAAVPLFMPTSMQLTMQCQAAMAKRSSEWFDLQTRYIVSNVERIETLPTQVRDLSIQTSFTMSKGHTESQATSFSWDIGAGINAASPVKFLDIFGLSGSTGVRYQKSWTTTDADQIGTAAAFQNGIQATVERLNFKLRSENVEKCLIVKLNPALYLDKKGLLANVLDHRLTAIEKVQQLTKGLMICQGEPKMKKMDFMETYFVINQRPPTTQVVDPNSESSRPFFAAIRGQHDFNSFISFLHGTVGSPNDVTGSYHTNQATDDKISNAFLQGVKSYPGHYISTQ